MFISRTPFRISFFGGGTDYPAWYLKEGGQVLSTTIDKYCYISCRYFPPFFAEKHRIVWSHIEIVSSISEILHPAVKAGLPFLGFNDKEGVEIHHQGDLPARAGMGSSSSFAVGLINALSGLQGKTLDKHTLALKAVELEQNIMRENVGSQDQVAAAYGGFNRIRFSKNGQIDVEPVLASESRLKELEANLMLFYAGASRIASDVASKVLADLAKKEATLRRMTCMVDKSISILSDGDSLDRFGKLLHEAWILKKELSAEIASPQIDQIYDTAIKHGALGGKLLGAGGTGFLVFYVPAQKQKSVREALARYLCVPFKFEKEGSVLIYKGSKY